MAWIGAGWRLCSICAGIQSEVEMKARGLDAHSLVTTGAGEYLCATTAVPSQCRAQAEHWRHSPPQRLPDHSIEVSQRTKLVVTQLPVPKPLLRLPNLGTESFLRVLVLREKIEDAAKGIRGRVHGGEHDRAVARFNHSLSQTKDKGHEEQGTRSLTKSVQ